MYGLPIDSYHHVMDAKEMLQALHADSKFFYTFFVVFNYKNF